MSWAYAGLGLAVVGFLFYFGRTIKKLTKDARRSEERAQSERQKRLAAEARESGLIDAMHASKMAHEKYKSKTESYIKAQSDTLLEHGINLVLDEDTPWGK